MRGFIYERPGWPNFTWDNDALIKILSMVSHRQGRLIGRMEGLGFTLQSEAILQSITLEVLKSNEIEGEFLDRDQVRSSIARKLGMDIAGLVAVDRTVDGVVEVMLNATRKFREPLTDERLFEWHTSLFLFGKTGNGKMIIGKWRENTPDDPMQVVSGPLGKERVHFQAPESKLLPAEMNQFLSWFNNSDEVNPILKAAVAHLWFVKVHPFDDGNGRLARNIAEMQLARADGLSKRFYSMSSQIRLERKKYYDILEKTQRGSTDITEWLIWFLNCLDRALIASENELSNVISKAMFWDRIKLTELNERQRKMINKLLDGFEGKLTSSKWARINKCSQDTALRDLQDLMTKDIIAKEVDGGRSTHYTIRLVN
jgi:Fic family protein